MTSGLEAIDLGSILVINKLAKPEINPLSEVDNDYEGISYLDDNDDDNDGIDDNQDEDQDENGIPDDSDNKYNYYL